MKIKSSKIYLASAILFLGIFFNFHCIASDKILNIATFNVLRLGHGLNKNYHRLAQIIEKMNVQIIAVQEVMTVFAAEQLLSELKKNNDEWKLVLSQIANGESSYKEYFAFYFQKSKIRIREKNNPYCSKSFLGVKSVGHSCFARDYQLNGPDFERDPFIIHIERGGVNLTLISVHLFYGGTDRQSIAQRRNEVHKLKRLMQIIKQKSQRERVIALGDFNLKIRKKTKMFSFASIPPWILSTPPRMVALGKNPTTIGGSSFDHFLYFEKSGLKLSARGTDVFYDFDLDSKMQKLKYKKEISDHFPVMASFDLSHVF